jgi:hypothetical protein
MLDFFIGGLLLETPLQAGPAQTPPEAFADTAALIRKKTALCFVMQL